jgi:predicted nucleic acid-binding protein
VDTNIIIDFWNNPSSALKNIFTKETAAICGIIKAELMHGAESEEDLLIISKALSDFEYIPIDESIWDEVGRLNYLLRKGGITIPFQDVILCALAIRYDLRIYSNDKHFAMIKEKVEALQLFEPYPEVQ